MPTSKSGQIDKEAVKRSAMGKWPEILAAAAGLGLDLFDGRNHPCPKCGKGSDHDGPFRSLQSPDGERRPFCANCLPKCGDIFTALAWALGRDARTDFRELLTMVADQVGESSIDNTAAGSHGKRYDRPAKGKSATKEVAGPDERDKVYRALLNALSLSPSHRSNMGRRGLPNDAIEAGLYRSIPSGQESIRRAAVKEAKSGGNWKHCPGIAKFANEASAGMLVPVLDHTGRVVGLRIRLDKPPTYDNGKAGGKYRWLSEGGYDCTWPAHVPPGIVGPIDELRITEGEIKSHVATVLSGVPTIGFAGVSSWQAVWRPLEPLIATLEPRSIRLAFDADHRTNGRIARCLVEAHEHLSMMGYEVAIETWDSSKGKGIDDALSAGASIDVRRGNDAAKYAEEVAASAGVNLAAEAPTEVNFAPDDPSRLARLNIERYRRMAGGEIKNWHGIWYTWTKDRGCWREIDVENLRGKLWESIEEEFERLNRVEIENRDPEKGPPIKRRVTQSLLGNVLGATLGNRIVRGSSSDMLGSWTGSNRSRHRHFIAMKNGLFDLEAYIGGKDRSVWLLPHTPDWFSTVRLPYPVDENATCPKWQTFLGTSLGWDPERIAILQEWAGYMLVADTSQQRFLVLIGEGANGKSVYCAGITAMLGMENCSFVPLEMLGQRFGATPTLGKLANICPDANEIDRAAEGFLKQFTAGDAYTFDRKGREPISAIPTARLMIACNAHPRFHDRTDGMRRREILMPFLVQIPQADRIIGMDKTEWWEAAGELPGIFMWAVEGLARLRQRGTFTRSKVCDEAMDELRGELNPAKTFLQEHFEADRAAAVPCQTAYAAYVHWSDQNGHRALSNAQFGKEVARVFPDAARCSSGGRISRQYVYQGIDFAVSDVCGAPIGDFERGVRTL